jgi:hypothetical protein
MKSSMKKLAVLMIMVAIAMFTVVATASAFDRDDYPKAIQGQYASTGGGTCLEAVLGFGGNIPTIPNGEYVPTGWGATGPWVIMTFNSSAVWTFKHDGTGKVARTSSYVFFSPLGCPTCPWPSGAVANDTWNFTYVIGADGHITLSEAPGYNNVTTWESGLLVGTPYSPLYAKGQNRRGTIAMDGMTIVLNGGLPDIITTEGAPSQLICNESAVLVRIKD